VKQETAHVCLDWGYKSKLQTKQKTCQISGHRLSINTNKCVTDLNATICALAVLDQRNSDKLKKKKSQE